MARFPVDLHAITARSVASVGAPGGPEDPLGQGYLDFVSFYHEYCEQYGKKIVSVGDRK